METIFSASELDGQHPFDAIKVQVCDVVRRLDAALGRPPFPNPSIEPCRALARTLVAMLRHVHQRNRIAALSACPEVNMTLPVLCASLTGGSEGRRPCPMLMELLLEALMYVHAVSAYPLHSTLKDAKEVLPHSPVTFRFFVVTGAIDVDSMRSFFGMPPAPTTEQQERNPATKRRRVTATKKNTESEKTSAADGEGTFAVPSGMLTAAFDVILPPDCMKVLLSLFNSTSKFQQAVGCDSELAARVLGVYGDHLLPTLRPTSLLRCLDVAVLDYFVDVVQMHGENMTLLTESVFMQIPMAEWNSERLTNLIHYCIGRKVRREEAFASLVVYVFLYKLLTAWETQSLPLLSIEEEAQLWIASLRTAQMVPFSTGTTPTVEEERLIKPLSVLAECVRRRHTISTVTAAAAAAAAASTEAHKSVGGIFHMLTTSLDAKVNTAPTTAAGGGTKRKKGGKKNVKITVPQQVQLTSVDSMDHYCRWIAESLCLVLWLTPPVAGMEDSDGPWCIVESLATLLIPSTEIALQRTPQASTWESFLNFLLSALCMHASTSTTSSLGRTTAAALVAAVQATHRLECCCILTQRMPDAYTALWWPLSGYRVVIEAWLSGSPSVDRFYAPFLSASPTECVGLLLSMMDENRLRELVCLLLDVEQTAMILLPSLEKAAQQRDPSNPASVDGFTRLHAQLCCAFENRAKVVAEQQQKKEESKKAQLLSAVWQKKELMEKANAFEREAQKFRVAKEEEHARIQQIREDRQREKEQRRERERREWQERRQKALALIQEMAEKTRVERLAEQREKLLQYRERVASLSRMSSFLEGLQVAPSRIMSLLAALRPYLHRMTHDELLEYVVTGDREVPSDMRAADDAPLGECTKERAEETVYFSDEAPSFWDGVMQLVAKHSGEAIGNSHVEVEKEDVPCVPTGGPSFHKRVSAALDLFDYSVGADASLPDPLPSVNVRTASRMLGREVLANTGFVNGREALLACQQRGLCVLRDGVCTLTRLGFRYHFPFHDPDLVLDVQLERRRREARRKLAEMQFHEAGGEEEEEDEETMSSDTDGDEKESTAKIGGKIMQDGGEELFCDDIASDAASDDPPTVRKEDKDEEPKAVTDDYDDVDDNGDDEATCVPYLAPLRRSTFISTPAALPTGVKVACAGNDDDATATVASPQELRCATTDDSDDDKSILQVGLEALLGECAASNTAGATLPICSALLKNHLGVASGQFRPGQQEVVSSILRGCNTLALFPTGWGKTLCFQFPMLVHRMLFDAKLQAWERQQGAEGDVAKTTAPGARFAVVVSPLLSLMTDQASRIASGGVLRTAILSSGTSASREKSILDDLASPLCAIDLLFVSPERLVRHGQLRSVLAKHVDRIAFICVDEVHCVSQWAYDFRPSFMYLHRVLSDLGSESADATATAETKKSPPFLCLTATAAPPVISDLQKTFRIERTVTVPYRRDNLKLESVCLVDAGSKKPPTHRTLQEKLLQAVLELPKPMLVYVQTRVDAEEFAKYLTTKLGAAQNEQLVNDRSTTSSNIFTSATHEQLRKNGGVGGVEGGRIVIRSYHAALERHVRARTQQQFMHNSIDVLIATVAFGMGIDKPDVRSVVHTSAPSSLESYVQETGRAGRDGAISTCRLLYSPFDFYTLRSRALSSFISPAEMLAVVQHILGSPTTKVGEKLTMVSVSKAAEELIMSEETVETILFLILTQEDGVLRELRGTAQMGYRVTHAVAEVVAAASATDASAKRKRGRDASAPSGVSGVLAQLEVLDGVFELCRQNKRIENVVSAANTLNMSLQDFQFRLNDLVAGGFVSVQRISSAYVVSLGEQFAEAAAPSGQQALAQRMWRAHHMRLEAMTRALEVTFAVLQNPTHDSIQQGLEWDARQETATTSPAMKWQHPPRGLTKVEAVQIANDFVEKNRPRIRGVYEAARALLGVLPKSLTSRGKYAGELPLSTSWYVGSPYFGLLREFALEWLLKVLAPHRLDEEVGTRNISLLPTA